MRSADAAAFAGNSRPYHEVKACFKATLLTAMAIGKRRITATIVAATCALPLLRDIAGVRRTISRIPTTTGPDRIRAGHIHASAGRGDAWRRKARISNAAPRTPALRKMMSWRAGVPGCGDGRLATRHRPITPKNPNATG